VVELNTTVQFLESIISDLTNLKKENFGKVVVHGHIIVDEPTILSNNINIDTGAGVYGPLTAIELPSLKLWQKL
jgi:acetylglutamate kinase